MEHSFSELLLMFCQFVGILTIFVVILCVIIRLSVIMWCWCRPRRSKWRGGPNTWAVITGSTDGIGLEYARQLAGKGYNLLLLSRNIKKLEKVKEDIECESPNCKVHVLAVDFTQTDIYEKIEKELNNLDEIHVLVNNVGIVYPNEKPEYFTKIPNLKEFIPDLINVNIIACTRLTALVLPRMEVYRRGIIINLSSFSALFPVPLLSLYSATKVYIDYMSRGLNEEYKHKGITIQSVLPFYVSTKMAFNIDSTYFVPSPEQFVQGALKTVGRESRTSGYSAHRFCSFLYFWLDLWCGLTGLDLSITFAYFRLGMIRHRIKKRNSVPQESDQTALDLYN